MCLTARNRDRQNKIMERDRVIAALKAHEAELRAAGVMGVSLFADYGATRKLKLSFDYLGQTLINAPRIFAGTMQTADDSKVCNAVSGTTYCGLPSMPLPTITGGKDTIALSSGALGMKYNLFNQLIRSEER